MTHAREQIAGPRADAARTETDTDGHSLLGAELGNAVIRDRQRDDAQHARDEACRRELKKPGRSVRSRALGR